MLFLVGTTAFRSFLSSEYSEENIDFWLECESYKALKDSKRHKMALKIYDCFLAPEASSEVGFIIFSKSSTQNACGKPKRYRHVL